MLAIKSKKKGVLWRVLKRYYKKGMKAGAKGESYNPKGYAPIDSVSRQKVGAATEVIKSQQFSVNDKIHDEWVSYGQYR